MRADDVDVRIALGAADVTPAIEGDRGNQRRHVRKRLPGGNSPEHFRGEGAALGGALDVDRPALHRSR